MRSRARIWRPVETRDALRNTVTTWTHVGNAWVEVRAPKRLLSSYGAGEQPQGMMEAELHAGAPLQGRDVLEVFAGPEKGTRWRTHQVHRPGDGSAVASLEAFHGELPAESQP